MLDQTLTLPEDPEELRSFTARLLAEVKAQAILIETGFIDAPLDDLSASYDMRFLPGD